MHTFLKNTDTDVWVGIWLTNREGYSEFHTLVKLDNVTDAVHLVSILNGGTGAIGVSEDVWSRIKGG